MANIKLGDRVRVKDRPGWISPPGYMLANAEGTVVKWIESEDLMKDMQEYISVKLDKAEGDGQVYIGNTFVFREKNLEKI